MGLAPSLAFGLGTPTRLTLSYYKLKQDNISDYGIPWVPATNNALAEYRDKPAPVPRETFYGFRDRDREILNQDSGTVRVEHDFSDSLQLRSQFRIGECRAQLDSNTAAVRLQRHNSHQSRDALLDSEGPNLGQPDRPARTGRDLGQSVTPL